MSKSPVRVWIVALAAMAMAGAASAAAAAGPAPVHAVSATPKPQSTGDRMAQLTAALSAEMSKAKLDVGANDLAAGKEASATLTLPETLPAALKAQAAKLGLGKAAASAVISAKLSGEGFAVTPNGEQSTALKDGQPVAFSWQVVPAEAQPGTLTADVVAALNGPGGGSVTLGQLVANVAPPPPPPAAAPAKPAAPSLSKLSLPGLSSFRLSDLSKLRLPTLGDFDLKSLAIPGHKMVNVPGIGPMPSQQVVTAAILLIIVILLLVIARNAAARRKREERRRRFRTFEGGMPSVADHEFAEPSATDGDPH